MRMQVALGALGLLLIASPAWAQTEKIQKEIEKKLQSMRKEQAALDELLAQALKNNPDIRVAESKVREADAELYRARVNTLNRVIIQQNEVRSAKAAADEAASRYEREKVLVGRGNSSAADLSAAYAAMMKFKADLGVKEAELDLLIGKHQGKAAEFLQVQGGAKPAPAAGPPPADEAPPPPTAVADAMRERIHKALDLPYTSGPQPIELTGAQVLEILRKNAKGVNILDKITNGDDGGKLNFKESIPLGALFQWAEDQFGWRFIVRDYGIIAVERAAVPPGALLLRDVWPAPGQGPAA